MRAAQLLFVQFFEKGANIKTSFRNYVLASVTTVIIAAASLADAQQYYGDGCYGRGMMGSGTMMGRA